MVKDENSLYKFSLTAGCIDVNLHILGHLEHIKHSEFSQSLFTTIYVQEVAFVRAEFPTDYYYNSSFQAMFRN